jgi:glycosyltransferase involved in cell wall biosynthesis
MLKYPVKVTMNYGKKYFKKNRTLKLMEEFYHSLDVFILPSMSEASTTVTMEAMACGLPIVATDVGNIRMLLDPEWIVPNTTDKEIIKGINYRLDLLKENPQLRKDVGECNRKHIENYFTWKQNQIIWDEVYSALVVEDYTKIKELSESYLEPFKNLY